jgi:hypothetical protein
MKRFRSLFDILEHLLFMKCSNFQSAPHINFSLIFSTFGQIGDFGILVGSGFSVFKALFFNFLSALVALAGTALVGTRIHLLPISSGYFKCVAFPLPCRI